MQTGVNTMNASVPVSSQAQPATGAGRFAPAISAPPYWEPGTAGLALLSACAMIWSEGDYINDIIKFTIGYPIYSPQVNNDSINYVPGAQLLTYCLAWVVGKAGSIPAYRVIQVGYATIAAFIAMLCSRRILRLAFPECRAGQGWLWNIFGYAALLLVATNSITNPFAHNLHADALAETANVAAFYLLLRYIESRSGGVLAAFSAAASALHAAAIAASFALWGEPFYYWVFYMLTKNVLLDLGAWVYWKDRAVVGDRATSIGDRGYSGVGDFSGILSRITEKHYSKILVRGYRNFDFVYDYFLFPKPTGIRQALLDNYQETGRIRAVQGNPDVKDWAEIPIISGRSPFWNLYPDV